MEKELTIQEIKNNPAVFLNQKNCYGFFDWFCRDSSLKKKGERLLKIALALSKSPRVDEEKTGIIFKNNCPLCGSLYDDLRFIDSNGDVVFTIIPHSGHLRKFGKAEIWGRENKFKQPLFEGTWKEAKKWFLNH